MKNKIIFILLVLIFAGSIMAYALINSSTALAVKDFEQSISKGNVQLVDIRTPEEYYAGKIENAINIDYSNKFFLEYFASMNPEKPVYIYCRSGVRTAEAAPMLEDAGFKEVFYLKGGITAWKEAGLKVVTNEPAKVSAGEKKVIF